MGCGRRKGGDQVEPTEIETGPGLTRSLARALLVLEALGEAGGPLGVTEIARRIGVHKSSVYRLLRTMVEYGYLEQHGDSSAYWLGSRLTHLGNLVSLHMELPRLARPHLERLSQLTRETVNLGQLQGSSCLYLLSIPTDKSIGMIARPYGATDPVYSTALGKAMLAFLPPAHVSALLRGVQFVPRTPHTVANRKALWAALDTTRARGYAVDDRENDEEVRCVGAPVFDRHAQVVGAVSVSAPAFRLRVDDVPSVAELVKQTAFDIATVLGCAPQHNPLWSLRG